MKRIYPALLLGVDEGGAIDVIFPDFPGCVSQGDDIADAIRMAQEALEGHMQCMAEAKEDIAAEPSRAKLLEASKENPGSQIALVEVAVPEGKAQRINITIPDLALAKIDNAVKGIKGETRSGLLIKAAMAYIDAPRSARGRARASVR